MGCTDSAQAISLGNHLTRPLENTLASLTQALGPETRAGFIETDVIRTKDDRLVLIHSTDFTQHVPPHFRPAGKSFIEELTLEEALALPLGADGTGRVPSLRQLLDSTGALRPGDDLVLNLEIKDVQGTPCPRRSPPLAELVLQEIRAAGFPLHRIRFSSFSLEILTQLADLEPKARLGMLFNEALGPDEASPRLFVDGDEVYRLFDLPTLQDVLATLPALEAVHPEAQTLTPETVALVAEHGLAVATWGWLEESPAKSPVFEKAARDAVSLCTEAGVELAMITDHMADLRRVVADQLHALGR